MKLRSQREVKYVTKEEKEAAKRKKFLDEMDELEKGFRKRCKQLEERQGKLKLWRENPELYPFPEEDPDSDDDERKKVVVGPEPRTRMDDPSTAMGRRIRAHTKIAKDYLRQFHESEGFDIDMSVIPRRTNMFVTVLPLSLEFLEGQNLQIDVLCQTALDSYNTQNNLTGAAKFKLLEYGYGTHWVGLTYRLTFRAITGFGQKQVFQASVDNPQSNELQVNFCRIKAPPVVKNVGIKGKFVEGSTVQGVGEYVGGRQWDSIFEWRRIDSKTGQWVHLAYGLKYTLTGEDIGHRLIFRYAPVDSMGQEGECIMHVSSEVVVPAASPSVRNVRIDGKFVEGNIIIGLGDYIGGKEGPSKFEWFRENKCTGGIELLLTGTKKYHLTREDVGHRLVFRYTPCNPMGVVGKSKSKLSIKVKSGAKEYTLTREDVGHHLLFKYTPSNSEGMKGRSKLTRFHVVQQGKDDGED